MQTEVESKLYDTYNNQDNQFRLRTAIKADFSSASSDKVTLGNPNIEKVKDVSMKNLPLFTWRVYSSTSAGDNSEDGFVAHAMCKRVADQHMVEPGSRCRGLYDLEQSEKRDMLCDHVAWEKRNGSFESRFISVRTSPLFALQLAKQKNARTKREKKAAERLAKEAAEVEKEETSRKTRTRRQHETNKDAGITPLTKTRLVNVPKENIHISVLDMSSLPEGTLLLKANSMARAYENGQPLTQNTKFFVAEHLVWEALKVESCHVPFDMLLKMGF